jgi:hypothetical protein
MHDYAAGMACGWMPVDLDSNPGMNVLWGRCVRVDTSPPRALPHTTSDLKCGPVTCDRNRVRAAGQTVGPAPGSRRAHSRLTVA